jgi:hypothetical protein
MNFHFTFNAVSLGWGAVLSSGADTFVSKSETPERVAGRPQTAAESIFH